MCTWIGLGRRTLVGMVAAFGGATRVTAVKCKGDFSHQQHWLDFFQAVQVSPPWVQISISPGSGSAYICYWAVRYHLLFISRDAVTDSGMCRMDPLLWITFLVLDFWIFKLHAGCAICIEQV